MAPPIFRRSPWPRRCTSTSTVPNFGIQEYMPHADETMEVFRTGLLRATACYPGDAPGFGVDYDDEAAAQFPYEARYLPVARRLDGSIHDW